MSAGGRPPVLLVHGAANSAAVWCRWQDALRGLGWTTRAIDLRGHGAGAPSDLSRVSMEDYADDVERAYLDALAGGSSGRVGPGSAPHGVVLLGWSMGGLVAMLAAARGFAVACVALAPSLPAISEDLSTPLHEGEFGPEAYGIISQDPFANERVMRDLDIEARQIALASLSRESRYARDQRKRGVVIEHLPCPLLIVTGSRDRGRTQAAYADLHLPADHVEIAGASHWGLVLGRPALAEAVPAVSDWLLRHVSPRQDP